MYYDRKETRMLMAAAKRAEKAGAFKSQGVAPMPAAPLFVDRASYTAWVTANGGKKARNK